MSEVKKNTKDKAALVPRLRFPEFRNAGEWARKTLADVCLRITNGKANAEDHEEDGLYPLFDRSEVVKRSNEFAFNDEAVIIPGEGMKFQPKYYQGPFNLHQRAYALMRHNGDARFVYYTMDRFKDTLAKNAVKSTVLSLRLPIIENFGLLVPSKDEQQKIADCLSSLDDLIAAETQKLNTLKTYKKGLMQQLFPREGETVPRLRFPEFRETGEWAVKTLGQLGELISGLTYSPDDVRDKGLLVLRSSNVQDGRIVLEDNVYVRSDIKGVNPSLPNDILICVRNGSKSLIGKNALIPEGMTPCTHGAFMTVFRSNSAKFAIQLFQTEAYERQVTADLGATINSINGNQLKKYTFLVPKPEEQKVIADFLASLDDFINAQTQKIEALKTHKKGLMQQLFPDISEG